MLIATNQAKSYHSKWNIFLSKISLIFLYKSDKTGIMNGYERYISNINSNNFVFTDSYTVFEFLVPKGYNSIKAIKWCAFSLGHYQAKRT